MPRALRVTFAALVVAVLTSLTVPVHAQTTTTQPPLEDVTLRGRVLNAGGLPLANTPVRVDAINDSGFAILAFFFTAGFSTLACFAGSNELCPIPNSKRFNSSTDRNGNYSFTFHNAHRRGIQTDTDYVLSLGVPSAGAPDKFVVASYELELQDAVHNAPDLRMWDPTVTVSPAEREYRVAYPRRPDSKNGAQIVVAGKPLAGVGLSDSGGVDARAVEDQAFSVVANAAKDIKAAGTIYHQRFTAAPVTRKGALVPLSRGAACTAARSDRSSAHCGYTDGDLVTPGVVDANACVFPEDTECEPPITKVTVDLGAPKEVGEVRSRCGCTLQASRDGAAWFNLPSSGTFGAQTMRYVAVSGESLGPVPEVSVWPPWPDSSEGIGLLPGSSAKHHDGVPGGDGDRRPWVLGAVALMALGVAVGLYWRRRGRSAAEVGRPL
jgi:hypothetical protein